MLQEINQSDEEKMKMYMKSTKPELIRMLIECNRLLIIKTQSLGPSTTTHPFDHTLKLGTVGNLKEEFVYSSATTTQGFTHTRKKGKAGCLILSYMDGRTETYIHCKRCNTPIWEEDNKSDLHVKCPKPKK